MTGLNAAAASKNVVIIQSVEVMGQRRCMVMVKDSEDAKREDRIGNNTMM